MTKVGNLKYGKKPDVINNTNANNEIINEVTNKMILKLANLKSIALQP